MFPIVLLAPSCAPLMQRSTCLEILRRLLAAVADHFVFDRLTLVESGQAGALDRGDMDEHIFAAALGLNEPVALRRVEPFHGANSHHGLLVCTNLIAAARPSRDRSSEVSVAYGKARGARQTSQARISGLYAVLARGSTARSDRDKGRTPLDNRTDGAHRHAIIGHNT